MESSAFAQHVEQKDFLLRHSIQKKDSRPFGNRARTFDQLKLLKNKALRLRHDLTKFVTNRVETARSSNTSYYALYDDTYGKQIWPTCCGQL